jgi:class 3 adenylate cyclase/DNA-binding response OmpR family regulator
MALSGETVLVVDDGRENRDFIVEYVLEPNGYRALVARDGVEGLEMAVKHRPDLILLDLNMPRIDGIGVLNKMAELRLDIPVILMTFHGSEDIAVEVYRLGVRDYVKKPYSIDEMEQAISEALTEVRLRREKDALTERLIHANRELQLRVQELNVIYSIGKSVTTILELDHLLPRLVEGAAQITHAENASLYLQDGDRVICRAQKRQKTGRAQAVNVPTDSPAILHVLRHGQPLQVTPEDQNAIGEVVSAAYIPITIDKKVIGVLAVENTSPRAPSFTHNDAALLSTLSDYAAIAITNSRNYQGMLRVKEQETSQIRGTFERFVPPSVVERVLNQPDTLQLGGTRQEISVLFADIRGYTSWSENAPPEQVVEALNHYLSLAAEIILAWEGTLDKFFGDGLMAIFNAPNPQSDHVHRAADAALALIKAADEVTLLHGHRLQFGIGVHVGEAVVGYIGTDRAVNYTAIGDVVNLTKRLQEYAAPGQILIEESIVRRLGTLVQARPLGEMKVKGRKQSAFAYELLGLQYPTPQK